MFDLPVVFFFFNHPHTTQIYPFCHSRALHVACPLLRGRLERAAITRAGAPVYIDYAHTPDAIEAALDALRPHASGRLILVFGAGGDRDQAKRPEMGRVAAAKTDVAIITDDNPRGEDPAAIRDAIAVGAPDARVRSEE